MSCTCLEEKFLESCRSNDLEKVKACLTLGVDVNTVSDDQKESGLTVAADKGYLHLLALLLAQPRINVNVKVALNQSRGQWTPLMFACCFNRPEVVRRLIQVPGLDTDHQGSSGYTAQHCAAINSAESVRALATLDTVNWNIKNNGGRTPLHWALYMGNSESLRIISSLSGVDFTVTRNDGETLAERAVTASSLESVKILAEVEQFNWNVVDKNGDSPLMITLKMTHKNILNRHFTLKKNKNEMFDVLVNCPRVDLDVKDKNGDTAAMWALKNNNPEALKKIVESSRYVHLILFTY